MCTRPNTTILPEWRTTFIRAMRFHPGDLEAVERRRYLRDHGVPDHAVTALNKEWHQLRHVTDLIED